MNIGIYLKWNLQIAMYITQGSHTCYGFTTSSGSLCQFVRLWSHYQSARTLEVG